MSTAPAGPAALEIRRRTWAALAWTHLTVRGALDARTHAQLVACVEAGLEAGHRITVDLSEVSAIDSIGARAVHRCETLADERRGELSVEDPSPVVRHALKALAALP
jgi:anti-anti-sigma regulatory factor